MSATKVWVVMCDFGSCTQTVRAPSATEARRTGRANGWRHAIRPRPAHVGGPASSFDFCPHHAGELDVRELREVLL